VLPRRLQTTILLALVTAAQLAAPRAATAQRPPVVAVVSRPGMRIYQQTVEAFRSQIRAEIRLLAHPLGGPSPRKWLVRQRPDLVLAVGQAAYDAVRPLAKALALQLVVHGFVFHRRDAAHYCACAEAPPGRAIDAFLAVRPRLKRITVLLSPGRRKRLAVVREAARERGLRIDALVTTTPARALSGLRQAARRIDALWLIVDLTLLTPQVVQYAIGLQFRRRIPLMGATRRHVVKGALFALDYDAEEVGRRTALLASALLAAQASPRPRGASPISTHTKGRARLRLNATTAQRIGVRVERIKPRAAEVLR